MRSQPLVPLTVDDAGAGGFQGGHELGCGAVRVSEGHDVLDVYSVMVQPAGGGDIRPEIPSMPTAQVSG